MDVVRLLAKASQEAATKREGYIYIYIYTYMYTYRIEGLGFSVGVYARMSVFANFWITTGLFWIILGFRGDSIGIMSE